MNQAFCQSIGSGAFPTPADVVTANLKKLQDEAGLGYRAKPILMLAQKVSHGLHLCSQTS